MVKPVTVYLTRSDLTSGGNPLNWSMDRIDLDRPDYNVVPSSSNSRTKKVPRLIGLTSPGIFFKGKYDISRLTTYQTYEVAVNVLLLPSASGWNNSVEFKIDLPSASGRNFKAHGMVLDSLTKNQWQRIVVATFTTPIAGAPPGGDINFDMHEHGSTTGVTYNGLVIKSVVIGPADVPQVTAVRVGPTSLTFPRKHLQQSWGWAEPLIDRVIKRTTPRDRTPAAVQVGYICPPGPTQIDIRGTCEMSLLTPNVTYQVAFYYNLIRNEPDISDCPVTIRVELPDQTIRIRDVELIYYKSFELLAVITVGDFTTSGAGPISFSITGRNWGPQRIIALLIHSVVFEPVSLTKTTTVVI